MLSNIINAGDKIDLYLKESRLSNEKKTTPRRIYKSMIYDITGESEIRIAMPFESGKVILLPVDGRYIMDFYTNGGIYQSYGKIIDRYKDKNLYVLVVELISKLEKIQRREFYRFNCSLELSIALISEKELSFESIEKIEESREVALVWSETCIADISGGGIRFISDTIFGRDDYVICKFKLFVRHSIKEFIVKGRIITSEKLVNVDKKYENRLCFIDMSKEDTEDIVRYIFEEERRLQKNRKS